MAFWTRFLKRKSPLLDAQDKALEAAGVFKTVIQFLVRQKPFWLALSLSLVLMGGGIYWVINVRPYMLGKKVGMVLDQPTLPAPMEAPAAKQGVELGDIPEITANVVESKAEATALLRQAETHYHQGAMDLARDALQKAIGLTADTGILSTAYANLANILDGEGRYAQAERYLQRALTFDRNFVKGYHNLGTVYLHMHEFDKALLAFQMAIRQNPDFAQSFAGIGEIHLTMRRYPEAVAAFTESLRLREDPSVRLNLGIASLQSGNLPLAINHFTAAYASSQDPYTRYIALFNRAYAMESTGRNDEAAADYRNALEISPKDIDALFNMGLSLMGAGRKVEALQPFLDVIRLDPDNMDAYFNAVTLHSELGQYSQALNLLQPVQQRIPEHSRVNYHMGHLLHRIGKLPESHESFNRVLRESRTEIPAKLKADAFAGLAAVFSDSGDLKGAIELYQQAIRLDNATYLYFNLARVYRQSRQWEEAIRAATTAVDKEPGNYTYVIMLAEVLNDAENLSKAFDVYKQAAEMSPLEAYPRFMMAYTASRQRLWTTALAEYNRLLTEHSEPEIKGAVFKDMGNIYHEQGNYGKALESYKSAAGELPNDSSLFYNIARTYFQMGRFDECHAALQKSLGLNPKSSEVWTLLGTYYYKKGLAEKAYKAFEEAVKINPENLEAYYNRDMMKKYQ